MNELIEKLKDYALDYQDNYSIKKVAENDYYYIVYVETPEIEYDTPVFVAEKLTGKIYPVHYYSKEYVDTTKNAKIIEKANEQQPKKEEETPEMESKKIRDLLKRYGAEDEEIENFMSDLGEAKEFNYLDYVDKLKLTEEGKDLIEKAPEMAKEELEKAVKELLEKGQ